MTKNCPRQILVSAAALVAAFLSGCRVSLGPGYRVERERLEVRAATAPARVHVRAAYRLNNVGTTPLDSIEVALPAAPAYARQGLRVWVNEREISSQTESRESAGLFRIPLEPSWRQSQKRDVAIEYDLLPAGDFGEPVVATGSGFSLLGAEWYPDLHSPESQFAVDVVRPLDFRVSIRAPADFQVISSGQAAGRRKQGAEIEYRFRLRKQDFDPFVVAGRYQSQQVRAGGRVVNFWTMQPLVAAEAKQAGERLAATINAYLAAFGPVLDEPRPVRIVEAPEEQAGKTGDTAAPRSEAFPGGALLDAQAFSAGVASEVFLELAERKLAESWFGLALQPRPEARRVLKGGAIEYATIVAAEARAGDAERQRRVALLLSAYDAAQAKAVEKPLALLKTTDPPQQRQIGRSKAPLFLIALEEECGEANVRRGLAHLVSSLRGEREEGAGFAELRSAVEQECGRDLATLFDKWLYQRGIPAEFRARHAQMEHRIEVGK